MLLRAAGCRHQPSSSLLRDCRSWSRAQPTRSTRSTWVATQSRWTASISRVSGATSSPPAPHVRRHATVAGLPIETSIGQIPIEPSLTTTTPTFRWDYTPERPLLSLPQTYNPPPARRSVLGHTPSDLIQHLHASLRVNRFDRAEIIIDRLSSISEATDAEHIYACELYIESRVKALTVAPGYLSNTAALDDWFFGHKLASKEGNQRLCILMMRSGLLHADPDVRDDRLKRFAKASGLSTEAILASPVWTDREYLVISAILNDTPVPDLPLDLSSNPGLDGNSGLDSGNAPEDIHGQHKYNLPVADIPAVLQVQQRGLSMQYLKQVLNLQDAQDEQLKLESQKGHDNADAEVLRNLERERLLENASDDAAIARWRAETEALKLVGIDSALSSRKINALMWAWYNELVPLVKKELGHGRERLGAFDVLGGKAGRQLVDSYAIYLEPLKAEKIAVATVIYMISACARGKDISSDEWLNVIKVADAAKALGDQIEAEAIADSLGKERNRKWYMQRLNRKGATQPEVEPPTLAVKWPLQEKIKIGAMLIEKFLKVAKMEIVRFDPRTKEKITKIRAAFHHRLIIAKGRRQGVIGPVADLRALLLKEPSGAYISKKLPMIVEPVPWSGFRTGGYLNHPDNFVRTPAGDGAPREYAMAAIEKGHMNQVFKAITALGSTPWRIHKDVLKVQIEAWNTGEAIGGLPPSVPQMEYPPEPITQDPHERSVWLKAMRELDNKKRGYHSQRCHVNLQLETARSFRNDVLYFPHNVDFRGRAYPIPPYLNHMGADNVRGLMTFAKGKELGPNGLKWLKIQLANVFGYDKDSFQGREQFVMDHLDDIYDSVRNPLSGKRWWLKSDDPWQTLAACFELTGALDSPDPTKFVSHLPIQQDGTCNGLQHYAALGGDAVGARQVNLEPGDKPSDVYTAVAESVKASIKKDLEEGNELAKMLDGKITRKVVKQPVMTNVYGVTYYGARLQVAKQLEDIFPDIQRTDYPNHLTLASYITRKIFNSMGEMFRGAQAIQDWLGKCADRVSTCLTPEQIDAIRTGQRPTAKMGSKYACSKGKGQKLKVKDEEEDDEPRRKIKKTIKVSDQFKTTVVWTTPLGFPVVQPYRSSSKRALQTALSTVLIQEPQVWDPVSRRKQMQAFPPNFIHSLDATHMMLSAMKCAEKDITFASIHDSFWTHASDREELSELLRDAFVHMHRENVIGRLKEEFDARYKNCMYLTGLDKNTDSAMQIRKLRKSKEFQAVCKSLAPHASAADGEVVVEQERLRLLSSSDPDEQARGAAMVTPASIYDEQRDQLVEDAELGDTRLGAAIEGHDLDNDTRVGKTDDILVSEEFEELKEDGESEPQSEEFEDAEEADSDMEMESGGRVSKAKMEKMLGAKAKSKATLMATGWSSKTTIWLPVTFPETPSKGTFDVSRLRQSKYFFH